MENLCEELRNDAMAKIEKKFSPNDNESSNLEIIRFFFDTATLSVSY